MVLFFSFVRCDRAQARRSRTSPACKPNGLTLRGFRRFWSAVFPAAPGEEMGIRVEAQPRAGKRRDGSGGETRL